MPRRSAFPIPLARKLSLLFGAAALATITVTLLFPWLQMNALDEEALLMQARSVATAACQAVDVRDPDWPAIQAQLARRWPRLAEQSDLPNECPELVPVGAQPGGFRAEAMERFVRNPRQRYYWRIQDEGRRFRYAVAIRHEDTDPHPHVLRGIVDVRLPVPRRNAMWNAVVTALAGASGAVLAILVFYTVTQRLVLSPVATLRRVAERVTVEDIEARAVIDTGDEFEDLAKALNDMLGRLKSAQEELRRTNRSLDIRLGELAETNVALYESNRIKSEFLANVSHELRTPLVSIIGFAELLRDAWENPDADRARLRRFSENILSSGRSLLEIINDLLDLTKIEAGKMQIHVVEFSLAELCRDLIDFVRPLADKKQQELSLTVADELPPCRGDSGKIKQILYNLLSNAVKFTPPGGSIALFAEGLDDQRLRLTVRDTGPGIPEEQRHRIFEKFHQLDASKTREHEGTGLGLAITKELVHILGGVIRLESGDTSGAVFVVELPSQVPEEGIVPARSRSR